MPYKLNSRRHSNPSEMVILILILISQNYKMFGFNQTEFLSNNQEFYQFIYD